MTDTDTRTDTAGLDFIRTRVAEDLAAGTHGGRVATRFPPEPNGYLHIGHAKSIVLNFGVAAEQGGTCNLRFDDTNPLTEDPEYVGSIQHDVAWLGYEWDALLFASDYFQRFYDCAEELVRRGLAYVDDLSEAEIQQYRGTVTEPGRPSRWRDRTPEENLDLLRRMRAGEFADGSRVLRARIDLAAKNMKMRDPLLYRIRHAEHYRSGDDWSIYPMYDFAHPLSDAFEGISHSLCTLEFENNREVYDWLVDHLGFSPRPYQIEFARLNLSSTVLSKRKLLELVHGGHVAGWDDPRMPTLAGLRRRGVTPEAIRSFCEAIGVAKSNSVVDVAQFEHAVRDDLNHRAPRVLGVLDPLPVTIVNYPAEGDDGEELDAPYWPHDVAKEGSRPLPFSRNLLIERDDFAEQPPKGWQRLSPGAEVRLRYAYFIRCGEVVRDEEGNVVELRCSYDPDTRGGAAPDGRRPAGTIHWVSADRALPCRVNLYDRLFTTENPGADSGDPLADLNPGSLRVAEDARVEPSVAGAAPGSRFQFERNGYFYLDPQGVAADGTTVEGGALVFNRTVTLRDSWAKRAAAAKPETAPAAEPKPAAERAAPQPPRDPLADLDEAQADRARGYVSEHGLTRDDAAILAADGAVADFFDAALAAGGDPAGVANWTIHGLLRETKQRPLAELALEPQALAELVALVDRGEVSSAAAKKVFAELVESGGDPAEIVARRGLAQLSDEAALGAEIEAIAAAHPDEAARYRGGEERLHGWFVGRVMRATKGRANPEVVDRLLRGRS